MRETAISWDEGLGTAHGFHSMEALHTFIKPKKEELKWRDIPWLTDLWLARRRSITEGRPIFLWAMNGHPLGCV